MKISILALAVAAHLTASDNTAGVDVSNLTGDARLVLNAGATEGAGETLDVKLQHSRDNGATDPWTDAGIAFAQVTNAAPSHQVLDVCVDGLKKYVRVVDTLGGAGAAVSRAVELVGAAQR